MKRQSTAKVGEPAYSKALRRVRGVVQRCQREIQTRFPYSVGIRGKEAAKAGL